MKGTGDVVWFDCATTMNATKLVLDNNTEYSGTATVSMREQQPKNSLKLSDAQTGMDSKVSSLIYLAGDDTDERATCKSYLEKRSLRRSIQTR